MFKLIVPSAIGGLLCISTSVADVVDIDASKDNTMYEEADDKSNGSGSYFFAGQTAGDKLRRGLIAFKIIAVGSDPDGSGSVLPELILEIVDPATIDPNEVKPFRQASGKIRLVK